MSSEKLAKNTGRFVRINTLSPSDVTLPCPSAAHIAVYAEQILRQKGLTGANWLLPTSSNSDTGSVLQVDRDCYLPLSQMSGNETRITMCEVLEWLWWKV